MLVEYEKTKHNERETNFFMMFIGTNRTGKTTQAINLSKKWITDNPNGKIYCFDPQNKFQNSIGNNIEYYIDGLNKWYEEFPWDSLKDGSESKLLIIDDYKLIHDEDRPKDWVKLLMNQRCNWNVDIIFITHSPSLVLTYLTYFITHYFIFATQTVKDGWNRKIPNSELCIYSSDVINEYTKYEEFRRQMPYCIVETSTGKTYYNNITNIDILVLLKNKINRKQND